MPACPARGGGGGGCRREVRARPPHNGDYNRLLSMSPALEAETPNGGHSKCALLVSGKRFHREGPSPSAARRSFSK